MLMETLRRKKRAWYKCWCYARHDERVGVNQAARPPTVAIFILNDEMMTCQYPKRRMQHTGLLYM